MKNILWGLAVATMLKAQIVLPERFMATFHQTVKEAKSGEKLHYVGDVSYEKGRIKWRYSKPTEKEICMNGSRVVVVEHDLEQATFYERNGELDLKRIIKSAKRLKPHIYQAAVEDRLYTLRTNKEGIVDSIAFIDELDNVVQILFTDIKQPKQPLRKALECSIPKEYDKIKE